MLVAPAVFGFSACATDICKSKDLPREQICNCQPKDNQLLDRLQSTDLPYPVRKVVLRCATQVRAVRRVVTKQALTDCTGLDTSLDQPTRDSLASVINRSNLMDDKQMDDWNTQCVTGSATISVTPDGTAPATGTPTTGTPTTGTPTTGAPATGTPATGTPKTGTAAPAPAATPAAQPK